jgi:hypothetical protein
VTGILKELWMPVLRIELINTDIYEPLFTHIYLQMLQGDSNRLLKAMIRILMQAIFAFIFLCVALTIFSMIDHRFGIKKDATTIAEVNKDSGWRQTSGNPLGEALIEKICEHIGDHYDFNYLFVTEKPGA